MSVEVLAEGAELAAGEQVAVGGDEFEELGVSGAEAGDGAFEGLVEQQSGVGDAVLEALRLAEDLLDDALGLSALSRVWNSPSSIGRERALLTSPTHICPPLTPLVRETSLSSSANSVDP